MHLLVGVVEHLSQRLDDIRQVSEYLLWSAVSHVAHRLNSGKLPSPIVCEKAFEEDGHNLLDGVIAEVLEDLRVGSVGAEADLLALVGDAVQDVWQCFLDMWLERLALGEGQRLVELKAGEQPQCVCLLS